MNGAFTAYQNMKAKDAVAAWITDIQKLFHLSTYGFLLLFVIKTLI